MSLGTAWQIFFWWKKGAGSPRAGMCTKGWDTNITYRGEGGQSENGRCKSCCCGELVGTPALGSRQRERQERRPRLQNCWKRTGKTNALSWQGRFLILSNMPTPWWGQTALSAHHRSNSSRFCAPLPAGWDPQGASIPRGSRWESPAPSHTRLAAPPGKAERRRSNTQQFHAILKRSKPSEMLFSFSARFFHY